MGSLVNGDTNQSLLDSGIRLSLGVVVVVVGSVSWVCAQALGTREFLATDYHHKCGVRSVRNGAFGVINLFMTRD